MSLIDVEGLSIEYRTDVGPLRAVDEIDFTIEPGETIGIVGESGCGKTTAAKSLLGMLDDNGEIVDGSIDYRNGNDLSTYSEAEFREMRWEEISYIAQNAMNALDPVYRVGSQIIEVIRHHEDVSKADARQRAKGLLNDVGLDETVYSDYPHELSGGQRQRVIIALSLALDPALIIADEPTTGLDVVVQDAILSLIKDIQEETGSSMVFITHDISAVAEIADRVAVMYGGRIVELGTVSEVFKESGHPYTMGLRNAFPSISENTELVSISGQPPDLTEEQTGCVFTDRCPFATEECQHEPMMTGMDDGHSAKCHYTERAPEFRERSADPETWEGSH
jgi:oligopeptide/dipeptide ABC transporter ATP-binding protein